MHHHTSVENHLHQ